MADVNYTFILSLIIISIGYLVRRFKIISEDSGKTIAKLVLNITLPAVILSVIPYIDINFELALIPIIGITFGLCVIGVSYLIIRKRSRALKGAMLMSVIGFNVGHFAFPLVQGIWGDVGLKYIAMFDIGNAFIIFVLAYIVGLIYSNEKDPIDNKDALKDIPKKLIRSVPLMTYIIAIIINFLNLPIPLFISDFVDILASANRALTLLLLGIFLDFNFKKSQWKNVGKVLIIRYGFGLGIGLLLFFLLPFNILYRGIIAIALILPVGLAILAFSVEFKFDEKLIGMITNLSIIISFILMWILILILGF